MTVRSTSSTGDAQGSRTPHPDTGESSSANSLTGDDVTCRIR
ncbi:MAG: hypothetical protein ACFN1A_08605 [Corynebacterium matruchotii]|nr:hypothetical protein [Corynebacterium matruchotii]DAQ93160.1 MAG TPA: hypothetical protein [Bacteriophage sp.]